MRYCWRVSSSPSPSWPLNLAFRSTLEASLLGGWAVGVNDLSADRRPPAYWSAYLASKEVQRDAPAPSCIPAPGDPELQKTRIHYKATLDALSGKLALFPNVPQSAQIITYLYKELNSALGGGQSADAAMDKVQAQVEEIDRRARYPEVTSGSSLHIRCFRHDAGPASSRFSQDGHGTLLRSRPRTLTTAATGPSCSSYRRRSWRFSCSPCRWQCRPTALS